MVCAVATGSQRVLTRPEDALNPAVPRAEGFARAVAAVFNGALPSCDTPASASPQATALSIDVTLTIETAALVPAIEPESGSVLHPLIDAHTTPVAEPATAIVVPPPTGETAAERPDLASPPTAALTHPVLRESPAPDAAPARPAGDVPPNPPMLAGGRLARAIVRETEGTKTEGAIGGDAPAPSPAASSTAADPVMRVAVADVATIPTERPAIGKRAKGAPSQPRKVSAEAVAATGEFSVASVTSQLQSAPVALVGIPAASDPAKKLGTTLAKAATADATFTTSAPASGPEAPERFQSSSPYTTDTASAALPHPADRALPAAFVNAAVGLVSPPNAPPAPAAMASLQIPPTTIAAEPVVNARPGQIGHEVGVAIAHRLSEGGDEVVVRLVPAELGRIEVRMSFDERGGLRAVIAADNVVALDMLRRDSADLSRSLADAGVRSDAQSLRFQTDSGGGNTGHQRSPWLAGEPNPGRRMPGIAVPDEAPPIPYRPIRTSGRYDLLA